MNTAKRILERKGHDIWNVDPKASVFDAITQMAQREVGALLVMDDNKLVGIISERDYARKVILKGRASKDLAVDEIMTCDVVCVGKDRTTEECMALMSHNRIRHLPVVDEEHQQVIGMLSIGDLVQDIIAEQKFLIDQLEHYITG